MYPVKYCEQRQNQTTSPTKSHFPSNSKSPITHLSIISNHFSNHLCASLQSHISQIAHLKSNRLSPLQSHISQIAHRKSSRQSPLQSYFAQITIPIALHISQITYLSNHTYQITSPITLLSQKKFPITLHISPIAYLFNLISLKSHISNLQSHIFPITYFSNVTSQKTFK